MTMFPIFILSRAFCFVYIFFASFRAVAANPVPLEHNLVKRDDCHSDNLLRSFIHRSDTASLYCTAYLTYTPGEPSPTTTKVVATTTPTRYVERPSTLEKLFVLVKYQM